VTIWPLLFALSSLASADTAWSTWTPQRVYDSHHKRFSDVEAMTAQLARQDVVFLGEQHDDPGTHRMELAVLEAIARRRRDVVLVLEMFERDVQPALDAYLSGEMGETEFLHVSRPWPNYITDYRPLVEFARTHGWRVVAGNIPRPIAAAVSVHGLAAIDSLSDSARALAAAQFNCPMNGDYYKRFAAEMAGHPMGDGPRPSDDELAQLTHRFYLAQCVKDETMAESIARVRTASADPPLVVHVNGDFHSDYHEGTAARAARRLPHAHIAVVSMIPVPSLDTLDPRPMRKRGDWLLFTLAPRDTTP
jgi:uncharacterized iron-regulated protein